MNTPAHFRFILESVEFTARRTEPILYGESAHFWDDIVDTWDRREEKPNYWLFCTRWLREELLKVMHRGSPRALLAILSILRPDLMAEPNAVHKPSAALKRRIVAMLLPTMMEELIARVRKASAERLGPFSDENAACHPEDLSW